MTAKQIMFSTDKTWGLKDELAFVDLLSESNRDFLLKYEKAISLRTNWPGFTLEDIEKLKTHVKETLAKEAE